MSAICRTVVTAFNGARPILYMAVLLFGAGWGLSQPLNKIAVTGGYQPYGIIFWQGIVSAALAFAVCALRGLGLPRRSRHWRVCLMVTLLGMMLPHWATYTAVGHIPAGVMAVLLALIPVVSFPIAIAFGRDSASVRRFAGLSLGLSAVFIIVAARSVEDGPIPVGFILIGLIAPVCYALNNNLLARFGRAGLDPVQLMLGAAMLVVPLALPIALATGQFRAPSLPPDGADLAMLAVAVIHTAVYVGFLWIIGQAGAVFAAQTSYFVTGFGVFWAIIFLGEQYPPLVWLAFAVMLAGLALVQPRAAAQGLQR